MREWFSWKFLSESKVFPPPLCVAFTRGEWFFLPPIFQIFKFRKFQNLLNSAQPLTRDNKSGFNHSNWVILEPKLYLKLRAFISIWNHLNWSSVALDTTHFFTRLIFCFYLLKQPHLYNSMSYWEDYPCNYEQPNYLLSCMRRSRRSDMLF